jgi:hypothetical protein
MKLNLKEFFSIGNKATVPAVSEDNNTGLTMHVGDDYEQMQDYDGDEEEKDDWAYSPEDHMDDFDKEPTAKDVKQNDASLTGIHKKQAQLQDLEAQKDKLLMQLKGDVISLDQYKQAVGNIPAQIKKLRADISQAMNVTVDDGSEGEAI